MQMSHVDNDLAILRYRKPLIDQVPRFGPRLKPLLIDARVHDDGIAMRETSSGDAKLAHCLRLEDEPVRLGWTQECDLELLERELQTAIRRAHRRAPIAEDRANSFTPRERKALGLNRQVECEDRVDTVALDVFTKPRQRDVSGIAIVKLEQVLETVRKTGAATAVDAPKRKMHPLRITRDAHGHLVERADESADRKTDADLVRDHDEHLGSCHRDGPSASEMDHSAWRSRSAPH